MSSTGISSGASSYNSYLREQAEKKLYYLREQHSPTEFDDMLDEQVLQWIKNAEMDRKTVRVRDILKMFWCF